MAKHPRIFTLNSPYSLRIDGELAKEIGLNESIVLLQLEFLISLPPYKVRDGRRWTYQSVRELKAEYFPWWSVATINRTIKSLEDKGYITVGNYNAQKYDKTRWFALNLEAIDKLESVAVVRSETGLFQNETRSTQNETRSTQDETRSAQDETAIPETPAETTTEIGTETAAGTDVVLCTIHHEPMERRSKDGAMWYSHQLPSGEWCHGNAGDGKRQELTLEERRRRYASIEGVLT